MRHKNKQIISNESRLLLAFRLMTNRYTYLAPFLSLASLLICSSCATQGVIKKAQEIETRGNYGESYTNLVQALKTRPQNQQLLSEKKRIGEQFSLDLLKKESDVPTNNLVLRIHLLEVASTVDSPNQAAATTALSNLRSLRNDIQNRAVRLTNSVDLAAMLGTAESLLPYSECDAELHVKLVNSPSVIKHAVYLFSQATGSNDLHLAQDLGRRCIKLWGAQDFEPTAKQIDMQLRRSAIESIRPAQMSDASWGNKSVYHLVSVLLNPDDKEEINIYRKCARQLVESCIPDAKIFVLGALSRGESEYLQSKIFSANADIVLPYVRCSPLSRRKTGCF